MCIYSSQQAIEIHDKTTDTPDAYSHIYIQYHMFNSSSHHVKSLIIMDINNILIHFPSNHYFKNPPFQPHVSQINGYSFGLIEWMARHLPVGSLFSM